MHLISDHENMRPWHVRKTVFFLVQIEQKMIYVITTQKKSSENRAFVARPGVEPGTSGLWILRSNHLSYLASHTYWLAGANITDIFSWTICVTKIWFQNEYFSKRDLLFFDKYYLCFICPNGEIGRRTVFRWRRREVCRFDSCFGHQLTPTYVDFFY